MDNLYHDIEQHTPDGKLKLAIFCLDGILSIEPKLNGMDSRFADAIDSILTLIQMAKERIESAREQLKIDR